MGVALLWGFDNVNVDTNAGDDANSDGGKSGNESNSKEVRACMSQEHLHQLRQLPVFAIKTKIRGLGVDSNKDPGLIGKEDLVQLYQIKARELAVKRHDAQNKKDFKNMSEEDQPAEKRRIAADKTRRMLERAAELEAQGVKWATFKAMQEFYKEEMEDAKRKKAACEAWDAAWKDRRRLWRPNLKNWMLVTCPWSSWAMRAWPHPSPARCPVFAVA